MSCVLGFDLGTRILGVAVGNHLTGNARALTTLPVRDHHPDWVRMDALLREWQPDALIVGLPLALDGGEQPMSRIARRFAGQLQERYRRPVHLIDERHSSQEAARRFADARASGARRRRHAQRIDADAAAVILDSWLQQPVTPAQRFSEDPR